MNIPNETMYQYMLKQNKDYMDNIALSFFDNKITYEEMHTRINEYAKALYNRGIRMGDKVCLCSGNTPETVFLLYALNLIGAIIVPLMPLQNKYKMQQDLEIAMPKYLIGINDSYKNITKASKNIKDLDMDILLYSPLESLNSKTLKGLYNLQQFIKGNAPLEKSKYLNTIFENNSDSIVLPQREIDLKKPTHILFTGGSTGIHKGVDLNENGLNNLVYSVSKFSTLDPGEVFMVNIPINLAFGNISLQTALCNNLEAALTLRAYPKDFVSEIKRLHPSALYCGPIHVKALNNYVLNKIGVGKSDRDEDFEKYLSLISSKLLSENRNEFDFSNLKCFCSGGEKLYYDTEQIGEMILDHYGSPYGIWNGLGMTEFWGTISLKKGKTNTMGTIGNVIPGIKKKIIDPTTNDEVEKGKPGILYVSGPTMMLGYHNNADATAELMSDGYFNTGDVVRENELGELVYVNRAKRQFVCGVDNIYPQEIENILDRIPEISELIVTKVIDSELQFLPKYHIYLENQNVNINKLQNKIEKMICKTLGASSLPGYYEYHDSPLPKTLNGKYDFDFLQKEDDVKYSDNMQKVMKKTI